MNNNRLMVKVQGGTRSEKRLCDTCAHSTIMKGSAVSQEAIYCNQVGEFVSTQVVECSAYKDKNAPSLMAMEEIAWVLRTDKSGQKIGFMSPDRWKAENKGRWHGKLPVDIDD